MFEKHHHVNRPMKNETFRFGQIKACVYGRIESIKICPKAVCGKTPIVFRWIMIKQLF